MRVERDGPFVRVVLSDSARTFMAVGGDVYEVDPTDPDACGVQVGAGLKHEPPWLKATTALELAGSIQAEVRAISGDE